MFAGYVAPGAHTIIIRKPDNWFSRINAARTGTKLIENVGPSNFFYRRILIDPRTTDYVVLHDAERQN